MYIIFIGLVLRIIFAFFNSFYGPLLGADADALRFHETAISISKGEQPFDFNTGWIYASILGKIYQYSISSIFFGSLLSIFAWLISAIILIKMFDIINIKKSHKYICLSLYSFWPSVIIFTSVTLREPYQLLFFNLAIFCFLKVFIEKKINYSYLFFFSLVSLSLLHKVFIVFATITVLIYFIFFINLVGKKTLRILFVTALTIGYITYLQIDPIVEYFYSKIPLNQKSIFEIVENHINLMTASRASYQVERIYIFNFQDFISYLFISTKNYFLQPTPSNQELFIDFMLYCENLIRLSIVFLISVRLLNIHMTQYKIYLGLLIIYFSSEIGWALGTNNWGSAVRHHVPTFGILIFLALFEYKKTKK
jgi:hypothetical protein